MQSLKEESAFIKFFLMIGTILAVSLLFSPAVSTAGDKTGVNHGGPMIVSTSVNPEKVVPGDLMTVRVEVESSLDVETVTAEMPYEGSSDLLELELETGSERDGTWVATWNVHDTVVRDYTTVIRATDIEGGSSKETSTWSDPSDNSWNFTNCGSTGISGPSQENVDNEYSGTSLEGEVTVVENGVQRWTVPKTADYRITVAGAEGGPGEKFSQGDGAVIEGEIALNGGEVLDILVGQKGTGGDTGEGGGGGGGGGGSFVVWSSSETPIIVAGGGGGCSDDVPDSDADNLRHARMHTSGNDGCPSSSTCAGSGGSNENGGYAETCDNNNGGGAGAGFQTNGEDDDAYGGSSFTNGGVGGTGTSSNGNGGFGGGGGADYSGGGGGGYSGGGAGAYGDPATIENYNDHPGGGGGCFIHSNVDNPGTSDGTWGYTGSEPHSVYSGSVSDLNSYNTGHGYVKIESLNSSPDSPTSPSPSDGATGLSTSVTLSVDVSDPENDSMDVTFYDSSDDTSIGTDTGVSSGGTASVSWSGLTENNSYSWYAVADDGQTTQSSTWSFTTQGVVSIGEAVDENDLSWTLGGDANWAGQTSVTLLDGDAAQSGDITDSQETYLQTTVDEGELSFYWKISSENNYDFLKFYIDGVLQDNISGTVDWTRKNYSLSSGTHTLKWSYIKNGGVDNGADAGYLDNVEFNPNQAPDGPTNPGPADGDSRIVRPPVLSVDVSDPDGDNLDVAFRDASDDSLIGTETDVSSGAASVTWNGLFSGTTYQWYAVADDGQVTTQSSTWSFTTNHAPDSPSNPSPSDGASQVESSTSLAVDVSDGDGDSMDLSFHWDNGGLIQDVSGVASGSIASTSELDLSGGETYSWYAVADDGELSITSSTWSFTANSSPDSSSDRSPSGGATGISRTPTLSAKVTDPEGDSMDVFFYKGSGELIDNVRADNGTYASVTWSGLEHGNTYDWYVVSDDGTDNTRFPTWSFSTITKKFGAGRSFKVNEADAGVTWEIGDTLNLVYEPAGQILATTTASEGASIPASSSSGSQPIIMSIVALPLLSFLFTRPWDGEEGLSPAIASILLIALTVVVIGVLARFLGGFGPGESNISAKISLVADGDTIYVTHDGGDALNLSDLVIRGDVEITALDRIAYSS